MTPPQHTAIPGTELSAMALTGHAVHLARGVTVPIGESVAHAKALSLARGLPSYAVVDRRSAAWVWGAVVDPPASIQIAQKWSAALARPDRNDQPILDRRRTEWFDDEVVCLAGIRVFTPGRVLFDFLSTDEEPDARMHLLAQGAARGTLRCLDMRPASGRATRVRKRLEEDLERMRLARGRR